jgi:hypothetical protein
MKKERENNREGAVGADRKGADRKGALSGRFASPLRECRFA